MALKITPKDRSTTRSLVQPGQRLFLTADRSRLVTPDDPDRRYLYCTEHQTVPREEFDALMKSTEEAEKGGSTSGTKGGRKRAPKGDDKAKPKGEDKSAKGEAKGE